MAEDEKTLTLTQAELDAKIETRLSRDRAARGQELADAQAKLAKIEKDYSTASEKISTLEKETATAAEYKKTLEEVHAGLLAEIPEGKRGLVPDKLSIEEQVRYIQKNKVSLMESSPAQQPLLKPQSPPENKLQAAPAQFEAPPGYTSLAEWAARDPKGYAEARTKQGATIF